MIIRKHNVKDLTIALGLVILDEELVIELSRNGMSRCNANEEICSILRDLKEYSIRSNIIDDSRESIRITRLLSYIARDIVFNGTLNIMRALINTKLDRDDGILLCLINNGGIIFSIIRDPLSPVCFRIPSNDYYLVELHEYITSHLEDTEDVIDSIFTWIDALWNERENKIQEIDYIKIRPIIVWKRNDKHYAIVKGKPKSKGIRVYKISSWGLDIDVKD